MQKNLFRTSNQSTHQKWRRLWSNKAHNLKVIIITMKDLPKSWNLLVSCWPSFLRIKKIQLKNDLNVVSEKRKNFFPGKTNGHTFTWTRQFLISNSVQTGTIQNQLNGYNFLEIHQCPKTMKIKASEKYISVWYYTRFFFIFIFILFQQSTIIN